MGVIGEGVPARAAAAVATTRSAVNMVVVGDRGVGKTSVITTLVSSIFPETVPAVLQQVHVPPEDTADNIALSISDTSSNADHRNKVLEQVRRAHVVIVVYSEEHADSFSRVRSYWLKAITQVFSGPIIVVGNKVDLLPRDTNADRTEELQRKTTPLVKEFKHQVDVCLQCSAKLNMNVNEVFYFAQHAVVYPVAPLLDTQTHTLTPAFQTALSRVFRVFDVDRDGLLSNVELNNFQEQCFGARLQPADIQGVKKVLQKEAFDYVADGGISLPGFLLLNQLFIQRNRVETPWLILRRFGYDDQLQLHVRSDALNLLTRVALDQSVELSKRALSFLAAIFHQFDSDKDGTLRPAELEQLFEICPDPAR
jgi:Ras family protein T1